MPQPPKSKAPLLLSYACPLKWESLGGEGAVRDCSRCSCRVENITNYNDDQLRELLAKVDSGQPTCVAFIRPERTGYQYDRSKNPIASLRTEDISIKQDAANAFNGKTSRLTVSSLSFALAATVSLSYLPATDSLSV